jgi:2-aminoadipate transaminase
MTTQTGPLIQTQVPESFCNLATGQPSPRLLPMELLAYAASRRLRPDTDRLLLQYATCAGGEHFREGLAAFLTQEFQARVTADTLMISNGISGALAIIFGTFSGQNRLVVSEDPTYFLARDVFTSSGAEVVGVPVDAEGLQVEVLEHKLRHESLRPSMLYTIPTHQNPTSACMSEARRRRLIELAEEFNFLIIADEPYNFLAFNQEIIKPFAALDEGRGRVISLGSFSKLLGPALRLGWIHAAPHLIAKIAQHGVLSSGGGVNPVMAEIVLETLVDGSLSTHIKTLQQVLGTRRTVLVESLQKYIPEMQFVTPQGGYFLWAKLPEGIKALALWNTGQQHALSFMPGTRCALGGGHQDRARLSFSFYEADEIPERIQRFAKVIEAHRAQTT